MPIRINNPAIKEEEKSVDNLIKYQVGKIRKLNSTGLDEKVVAEEVRKLHVLVSKNNSSVKDLRFGIAQEDADEFIGTFLNCLNDERGPFFESSLITPTDKESREQPEANSFSGQNTSVIKIPLGGRDLTISGLFKAYQEEEIVDKDNGREFPIGGGKKKLSTSKKLSVFVQDDKKEIYLQLKRFKAKKDVGGNIICDENGLPIMNKISSDIIVDNIQIPVVEGLKVEEKNYFQYDSYTRKNVNFKYQECEEIDASKCKKATYEPTAFVIHCGNTLRGGHYYSYVKEREANGSDSWYRYDDGSRSKVEEAEAKEAMKQAYIIKYSPRDVDNKVDLPLAYNGNSWSDNLGNTCWANSSIAIVARSKSSEEYENIFLDSESQELYKTITGYKHDYFLRSGNEAGVKAKINFLKNDILDQKVDVVVNAGNAKLDMGTSAGGLSGAFHKDIGTNALVKALTELNTDVTDARNNLEEGKVAVAKVSDIENIDPKSKIKQNAQYIIHAVGPNCGSEEEYRKNKKVMDEALEKAYSASFDKALELRAKTIAIPALSVGLFHFPKDEAAKIIAKVLHKYEDKFEAISFCCIGTEADIVDKVSKIYKGDPSKDKEAEKKSKKDQDTKDQEEASKKKEQERKAKKDKEEAEKRAKEESDKESNSEPKGKKKLTETEADSDKKKPASSSLKEEEPSSLKTLTADKANPKKKKVSFEEAYSEQDSERRDGRGSEQRRGQDSRNLAGDFGKKSKDNSRDSHSSNSRDSNADQSFSKQRRSLPMSEEQVVEVLRVRIANNLDKVSEAEAPETIKLITKKSAEVESRISDKAKNIKPVEYVEEGEKDHKEYRQYVEKKYKGVHIESLEQYSSNPPSIKTLELVEKEIQNQDKVFDNKLARALNNLRKVPEHLDKDEVDVENTWKSLTTLDRRVLVDYHNISKGSNLDFMSLYKEAKDGEKTELTVDSKNYVLDSSKLKDIKEILSNAAADIPKNMVTNPVVEKLINQQERERS